MFQPTCQRKQFFPCNLQREDVRDAFISVGAASLAELPTGSVVGRSHEQNYFKHSVMDICRLSLMTMNFSGWFLLEQHVHDRMHGMNFIDEMLPALPQGADRIACRSDDDKIVGF
ncbi:hypothetical protein PanWU01x14_340290 [Parasponia andersonii]|uniref:Uncharacterized protein n=1 Tax=Parasponia andersonii TaxID=3476 RepID=A0A2P5AEG5_PARAD|nr:hypothetical protein PanWU01x14_340290 [Parasponia andersonii]